jgi:hypothetical protein
MNTVLLPTDSPDREVTLLNFINILYRSIKTALLIVILLLPALSALAQWTAVSNTGGPAQNGGVMLLLPDGRVMCKSQAGSPSDTDGYGNIWDILTPGSDGNYANGTWSHSAPMFRTRLYFISQVLADGRVFVAGGEYGDGGNDMEVYNPLTNTWSHFLNYGSKISDANSEMLPDGRVLGAPVGDRPHTFIWNPATNNFVAGPDNLENTNESSWVKLPDNSILFVPTYDTRGERYNPNTNAWQYDASTAVDLYSQYGAETGTALMLPDGRAFFTGGGAGAAQWTPNTAYYTPSGNTSTNGTWANGPTIPNDLCAPDAAAAMMRNGITLNAFSPTLTRVCCKDDGVTLKNQFNSPTTFWEFNYNTNIFTQVAAPGGGMSINMPSYNTNMLDLPNGQVLYGQQGSSQYYVYQPGAQINSHRPVITDVSQTSPGVFTLTGTEITGWSAGATYGDDWQMNTNYPIVKLTSGSNVYYARTYNWSSTAVRAGSTPQTTNFVLPAGLPNGSYSLVVVANGIESASVPFCTPNVDATARVTSNYNGRDVSCFNSCDGAVTVDVVGGLAPSYSWTGPGGPYATQSVSNLCPGVYTVTVTNSALSGGCSSTSSVTIQNTPQLTTSPAATSNYNGFNVSCNGSCDGSATANPAGGTPPYTYSWNTNPVQTTATATGLCAANYHVTVTDANGCTAGANVTLTQPPPLTTTASPTTNYNGYNVRCHNGSDGAAKAFPTGGVPPYTYSWNTTPVQTTQEATGLSATTYTVTVTDANGCTANAQTTLTEPPQLTIDAGANKTVYYGYPDSACATLTATGIGGGVPPYTLHWSTGASTAAINVCPITTTIYYVTVTDLNNCTWQDSVKVCVIDVRCGNNLDKVTLCHNTGSNSNPTQTLCVALPGAINHIAHGDQLAACGTIKTCNFNAIAARLYNPGNGQSAYMTAFPNPFTDYTTVRFRVPTDQYANLKLYDISGRMMSQLYSDVAKGGKSVDITFDGSNIPAGIYFLILKTGTGETYVSKLTLTK